MRLLLLALLLSPAEARVPWEIQAHLGAGRIFGKGADANRFGGTVAVSGGPRVHPLISLRMFFQAEYVRMRKFGALDEGDGESFVFAVGPYVHPLAGRYRIQPYIGPLVGIAYTRAGVIEGDAEVEFRSRAVVVGGTVGAVYQLDAQWAVGAAVVALPLFVDKACLHIVGDSVSCGAEEDALNVLGSANLTVQYRF